MPIRIVRDEGIDLLSGRLSVALCRMVAAGRGYMAAILDAYSEVRESNRYEFGPGCLYKGYNQFVPLVSFVWRSTIGYRGDSCEQRVSTTRRILVTEKRR